MKSGRVEAPASNTAASRPCATAFTSREGRAEIACHVIHNNFEPAFHELRGILRYGEQNLPGPLPATSTAFVTNPRFLSVVASYDVGTTRYDPLYFKKLGGNSH